MKHSWKNSRLSWDSNPVCLDKIQCPYHWAKASTLWHSCKRLNIYEYLQAMRNLPRQIIEGRVLCCNTPRLPVSHHLLWREAIFGKVKSNFGQAPILRHESSNKGMKYSWKSFPPIVGFEPGLSGSNHCAKESTPCAVVSDWQADNRR